jgi:hypothetical protein
MPRPPRPKRRLLRIGPVAAGLLAGLSACSDVDGPAVSDPVAPEDRDRESWGVRIQLLSPTSRTLTVDAPYLTDHLDEQLSRADSGVAVTLGDSTGEVVTRLSAHRLVVDHRAHTVALSGTVSAVAPEQRVSLIADTVTWDRTEDRLDLTEGAEVVLATGRLRAERLSGTSDMATWTAHGVRATLQDSGAGWDPVEVDSPRALVQAGAAVMASFDSLRAVWRERSLRAHVGAYDGERARLDLAGEVTLIDSSRQVRADSVRLDLAEGGVDARGEVRVSGDLRLRARRLSEADGGRWTLAGDPVEFDDDERHLRAAAMTVSAGGDSIGAGGGVHVGVGERSFAADSLHLVRPDGPLDAVGAVRLESREIEGVLTAGRARSVDGGDLVALWEGARFDRERADDSLVIEADTLRLQQGELRGSGAFRLQSPPRVELRAGVGRYATEGDTARLARATEFRYDAGTSRSRLRADSSLVFLDGGEPVGLRWPDGLSGRTEDARQTSWITAAEGAGELNEGRLVRLTLTGGVEVTHRGDAGRLSRFTAAAMELTYDDDGVLQGVVASGDALVQTRLDEEGAAGPSTNEVRGEELDVDLEEGEVVSVAVLEGVEGRFVPEENRETP